MGHVRNLELSDLFLDIYHFYMKALLKRQFFYVFRFFNNFAHWWGQLDLKQDNSETKKSSSYERLKKEKRITAETSKFLITPITQFLWSFMIIVCNFRPLSLQNSISKFNKSQFWLKTRVVKIAKNRENNLLVLDNFFWKSVDFT